MEFASGLQFRRELRERVAQLEAELAAARDVLTGLDVLLGSDHSDQIHSPQPKPAALPSPARHVDENLANRGEKPSIPLGSPGRKPETRWDRIDRLMEKGGGRATIRDLVKGLIDMGDNPSGSDARFYNVIDSAMRTGEKRGRYRRTGNPAEWEFVPGNSDLFSDRQSNEDVGSEG